MNKGIVVHYLIRIFLPIFFILTAFPSFADSDQGVVWLSDKQQTDGGVYQATDIANPSQSSLETLVSRLFSGSPASVNPDLIVGYLQTSIGEDTELLAAKIIAGLSSHQGESLTTLLTRRQNADGGFANKPDYQSTPYDTYWALRALEIAGGLDANTRFQAISYLVNTQTSAGAWGYIITQSVYLTGRIVSLLVGYQAQFAIGENIARAQTFLTQQTLATTPLDSTVFQHCVALSSLSAANTTTDLSVLADQVLNGQAVAGSWAEDVFSTALCLRALLAYEASKNGALLASVTGRAVISGSDQPIAGVQVSVAGNDNLTTLTDAEGRFSFSGLTTSSLNLNLVKSGYLTAIKSLSLLPGSNELGAIPLAGDQNRLVVLGTVVDAATRTPLMGAELVFTGASSAQIQSDSDGAFSFASLSEGNYTITVNAVGYHSITSNVALVVGSSYDYRFRLNSLDTVLDDTPTDLSGRIVDGASGLPIDSVALTLDGVEQATTDTNGLFIVSGVARGDHTLALSHPAYVPATYNLNFPPGSNGQIGDLPLYVLSDTTAADTISLTIIVRDAVTQAPVANTSISQGTRTVVTDSNGQAQLLGIESTSFTLAVSAAGYLSQTNQLTASGFGDLAVTFALTPDGDETSALSLQGVVRDNTGQPISDAILDIDNQNLTIATDNNGQYNIADINSLSFTLTAEKEGFIPLSRVISVERFGNYLLDLTLEPVGNDGWQIYSVQTSGDLLGANTDTTMTASVQNLSAEVADVIVRGQVFDSEGAWIKDLTALIPGTTQQNPVINFAAGQVHVLGFPFNTGQLLPGQYLIKVDVIENGSISASLPSGVVFTSGSTHLDIASTVQLGGALDFSPPLTQAGSDTLVNLSVFLANAGNDLLPAGDYQLSIANEVGDELLTRVAFQDELTASQVAVLDFGTWVPTEAGHLSVTISRTDFPDAGNIVGIYYVGDLATAEFYLDQQVFPEGDSQTTAHFNIKGVDTTQGGSTDPLFEQVRQAVTNGGAYVGDQAVVWHKRNRCLGCHTQTQSLLGMSSAIGQADINQDQTNFLFNVIASSQQNDGRLRISHDGFIKTQNMLSSWALSEWQDKQSAHRTKLKALDYLWGRRTTSGDQVYWVRDHNTGWLSSCCEGGTSITTKAIAELIRADQQLADTSLPDYQLGTNLQLNSARARPFGVHQVGDILYIAKQGMIERFNTLDNSSEVVYLDANNRQLYDVWFDADGTLFATTDTLLLRINSDSTVDEVSLTSGLRDIVRWQGELYVSDWNNHRIWRVSNNLDAVVFVSGGLLNVPVGLTIGHDDQLLIANKSSFNILSVDSAGVVDVFVDGLAFPPHQIEKAAELDHYYVSTERYSNSGATSPSALHLIRADKTLASLVGRNNNPKSMYSIAEVAGDILFTDNTANVLGRVTETTLDRSLITTLKNGLPNIANYFLARQNANNNEIVLLAFRLMGLAELNTVVEDSTLKDQLAAAIVIAEQMLRERQRGDGGWGRFSSSGSDPLTTAWVGYALDYTNPSAEDPMVRNAITYLLNTQGGDGSWPGQYFSTRLGSTSMVMAYMPRALERLGGLDVSLDITLPDDITLLNASVMPDDTQPLSDGSVNYHWDLIGVTGSGRQIDLDLAIANLILDEVRPVATNAQLQFANSFTGEIITRAIDIPEVTAASELQLTTATDKVVYGINEPVVISSVATNTGPVFSDGILTVALRTAGGATVAALADQLAVNLLAGEQQTFGHTWNTGLYPAGSYQVYATVRDSQGRLQIEAIASFTIQASDGQQLLPGIAYGTGISTDKQTYLAYEPVQVESQVINQALNASQSPVLAVIAITDPNGQEILRKNIVVTALEAGAVNTYFNTLALNDAPAGIYQASITLWNVTVAEQLATDSAMFSVIDQPLAHLVGSVTVDQVEVNRGQPVNCTEKLSNRSASVSVESTIYYRLMNVDSQSEVTVDSELLTFSPGQEHLANHPYDTGPLKLGNYACLLQADINGQLSTLDFAGFTVTVPPIVVTLETSNRGRLLILMDALDANGTSDLTSLANQETALRALLDNAGYSYTIVFNADDFAGEFHSGLYHSYALFSEKVTLLPEVEQQLGEAVNAGAGFVIAGAFNRRNNHIERALGIYSTGREQQADGVLIPAGALGETWPETVINPPIKLDFERCGSNILGSYINPKKGTATDEPNCYNLSDVDAAAVAYRYGQGNAVYIGFDTLDEGTRQEDGNPYEALMQHTFDIIQPDDITVREGVVIPIKLSLASQTVPVSLRVMFNLSDNLNAIDQVPGMTLIDAEQGIWQWTLMLNASSSADATVYGQLLNANSASVDITVSLESDGQFVDIHQETLILIPESEPDYLAEATTLLQSLLASYPDDNRISQALTHVQAAQTAIVQNDIPQAISQLLSATDQLMDADQSDAQQARLYLDRVLFNLLAQG